MTFAASEARPATSTGCSASSFSPAKTDSSALPLRSTLLKCGVMLTCRRTSISAVKVCSTTAFSGCSWLMVTASVRTEVMLQSSATTQYITSASSR